MRCQIWANGIENEISFVFAQGLKEVLGNTQKTIYMFLKLNSHCRCQETPVGNLDPDLPLPAVV
jgi:hypothetical protein